MGTTQQHTQKKKKKETRSTMSENWSSGLFDCFSDMSSCLCVWRCLPCAVGQLAEMINTKQAPLGVTGDYNTCCMVYCFGCCAPCLTMGLRARMRNEYKLKEEPCGDFLVHCCCLGCAICQETREMKKQCGIGATPMDKTMDR